jgi:hypothetical protein
MYNRFKYDIKDSQIFDRLKMSLGNNGWSKLMKKKVFPVNMNFTLPNLGLDQKTRQ